MKNIKRVTIPNLATRKYWRRALLDALINIVTLGKFEGEYRLYIFTEQADEDEKKP